MADWQSQLDRYDFELPGDRIAVFPSSRRGDDKLMVVDGPNRKSGSFAEIHEHLRSGDILVRNTARVRKAILPLTEQASNRLHASLFISSPSAGVWQAMVPNQKRLVAGSRLQYDPAQAAGQKLVFELRHKGIPATLEQIDGPVLDEQIFEQLGQIPLPPYLKRQAQKLDEDRYQTVFAQSAGSVAAPTAGLHFTEADFVKLQQKGVIIADVHLQIGLGTFAMLKEENLAAKKLHSELVDIPAKSAQILQSCHKDQRIIALGTTSLRALEANFRAHKNSFAPGQSVTDLFLHPPDEIQSVKGLITNFHLPRSSLFMLVCCLAGRENLLAAYQEAIDRDFRFFSYGDAMLVWNQA